MASTEESAAPSAIAKVSLGLLIAIGLARTAMLVVGNGLSLWGFTLAGNPRALAITLAGTKVWIFVVDALTIYLVIMLLRREGESLKPLFDPRPIARNLLLALGGLVIVYFAFFFGGYAGNQLNYYGAAQGGDAVPLPVPLAVVRLVLVPITIAVAEESLFRGYLMPRLQVHMGRVGAVIVSSLLAGAQYLAFNMGSWDAILAGFIGYFIVNLAFGALYLWFKRLAPLVLIHWLYEAVAGLALLSLALHH
jgi:membrane protease YdiL (CAAX protease family)